MLAAGTSLDRARVVRAHALAATLGVDFIGVFGSKLHLDRFVSSTSHLRRHRSEQVGRQKRQLAPPSLPRRSRATRAMSGHISRQAQSGMAASATTEICGTRCGRQEIGTRYGPTEWTYGMDWELRRRAAPTVTNRVPALASQT